MRHFIDHNGQPATVKFVPEYVTEHLGSLQHTWVHAQSLQIVRITVDPFHRANIYIRRKNKSLWAGKWIVTNFNPQHWIQLSAADTEEEALAKYATSQFDKDTIRPPTPTTPKRTANGIKNNEKEQIKHFGQTALEFIEALAPEYQQLVEYIA